MENTMTQSVRKIKVMIKDLPDRKDLIGKRFNMTRQGGKYHYDYQNVPKMRIFLGAKRYTEKGIKWVQWNWQVEATHNTDNYYSNACDCGYSGIGIEGPGEDLFSTSYLLV